MQVGSKNNTINWMAAVGRDRKGPMCPLREYRM